METWFKNVLRRVHDQVDSRRTDRASYVALRHADTEAEPSRGDLAQYEPEDVCLEDRVLGEQSHKSDGDVDTTASEHALNSSSTESALVWSWSRKMGLMIAESLLCLLPSFLYSTDERQAKRQHATSWLDGMRGVSALLVVVHHTSLFYFSLDLHYGWSPGDGYPAAFLRLPIIRFLISGSPHVAIFFVVSGFSISHKPLRLARAGRFGEASSALCSSILRRHTRLFLPAAVVGIGSAVMRQLFYSTPGVVGFPGIGSAPRVPPLMNSTFDQLVHFARVEFTATRPFKTGMPEPGSPDVYNNPYDGALWTLPVEFTSSIVVFGFLLAFLHIRSRLRIVCALLLAIFVQLYWTYWALFLFLAGMIICELHLAHSETSSGPVDSPPAAVHTSTKTDEQGPPEPQVLPRWAEPTTKPGSTSVTSRLWASLGRAPFILLAICGLWVITTPESDWHGRTALGYTTMYSLLPVSYADNMYTPCGAAVLVLAVDRAGPVLQCIFTTRIAQYLGRISYALYLVHGTMTWSLGDTLLKWFVGYMSGGPGQPPVLEGMTYFWAVMLTALIWWPITIWVADLTARYVDENCVRFTHWMYGKMRVEQYSLRYWRQVVCRG